MIFVVFIIKVSFIRLVFVTENLGMIVVLDFVIILILRFIGTETMVFFIIYYIVVKGMELCLKCLVLGFIVLRVLDLSFIFVILFIVLEFVIEIGELIIYLVRFLFFFIVFYKILVYS